MFDLFKKQISKEEFWSWFLNNEDEFFELDDYPEPVLRKISAQFKKLNTESLFEIGPIKENGKRDFVISADGNLALFENVTQLVDSAPECRRFDIIAFRQRKTEDVRIKIGKFDFGYDDYFFKHEFENGKINVHLFIKGYHDLDVFKLGSMIILDAVAGEYDVETKIGTIDFGPFEDQEELLNIRELPHIIDHFLK